MATATHDDEFYIEKKKEAVSQCKSICAHTCEYYDSLIYKNVYKEYIYMHC